MTSDSVFAGAIPDWRQSPWPRPAELLADYRHWLAWRARLTRAHADQGFSLCFRLEEAPPDEPDNWRLHFLVAASKDPSLKLSLAEGTVKNYVTNILQKIGARDRTQAALRAQELGLL